MCDEQVEQWNTERERLEKVATDALNELLAYTHAAAVKLLMEGDRLCVAGHQESVKRLLELED